MYKIHTFSQYVIMVLFEKGSYIIFVDFQLDLTLLNHLSFPYKVLRGTLEDFVDGWVHSKSVRYKVILVLKEIASC